MRGSQPLDLIDSNVKRILDSVLNSEELNTLDALDLLKVNGREFFALQYVADLICREKKEDLVTFVVNRNINFTNICYQGCNFCSFSVGKNHESAFLLSIDEIGKKVQEALDNNCTEVCIQGGINPDLSFEYYLEILKKVKAIDSNIHVHAFSPQEIWMMGKLANSTIESTLKELKSAGLDSIPGTAAEILVDKVRKVICPNKVDTETWKNIIITAHNLGIPTTSTMMYGHIEDLRDRIAHLDLLREIQKDTGGFTEFVPLPFVKEKPILSRLEQYPLNPSYGMADLRLFSVARLFFNDYIDNIQCSWVKLGPKFAQISLNYGVNDFSGTLIEENISKSAGAEYGEYLPASEMINIIRGAGKKPAQRDTLYNIIEYY